MQQGRILNISIINILPTTILDFKKKIMVSINTSKPRLRHSPPPPLFKKMFWGFVNKKNLSFYYNNVKWTEINLFILKIHWINKLQEKIENLVYLHNQKLIPEKQPIKKISKKHSKQKKGNKRIYK